MESKTIIFVVFTVVVQSSAGQDSAFLNQLATIQSGRNETLKSFFLTVDDYFDTMLWLANVGSENRRDNVQAISHLESVKENLHTYWLRTFQYTEVGLKPITVNVSAFSSDNIEERLNEVINLAFSPFYEIIRGKSYSRIFEEIEAIEKKTLPKVYELWYTVYDILENAVSAGELEVINAVETIRPKGATDGRRAFGAIFAGFKILLLELYGKPQARGENFSSLIEIVRNVAHVYLTDEADTKFALFYYVAAARYVDDITTVNYYNEIEITEFGVYNQFESATDSVYTTIIERLRNNDLTCTIETLSCKIFSNLYGSVLTGVLTLAATQLDGEFRYDLNHTAVYRELLTVSRGITEAIKLTQKSNTCGVRTGIRRIEKKVVAAIVDVFQKSFDAMGDVVKVLGRDALAIIDGASKNASIAIESATRSIFHAIEITLNSHTSDAQSGYCDTDVSAISIDRDVTLAGFKEQMILKFGTIRMFNLYVYLRNYGISVSLSLLRGT